MSGLLTRPRHSHPKPSVHLWYYSLHYYWLCFVQRQLSDRCYRVSFFRFIFDLFMVVLDGYYLSGLWSRLNLHTFVSKNSRNVNYYFSRHFISLFWLNVASVYYSITYIVCHCRRERRNNILCGIWSFHKLTTTESSLPLVSLAPTALYSFEIVVMFATVALLDAFLHWIGSPVVYWHATITPSVSLRLLDTWVTSSKLDCGEIMLILSFLFSMLLSAR